MLIVPRPPDPHKRRQPEHHLRLDQNAGARFGQVGRECRQPPAPRRHLVRRPWRMPPLVCRYWTRGTPTAHLVVPTSRQLPTARQEARSFRHPLTAIPYAPSLFELLTLALLYLRGRSSGARDCTVTNLRRYVFAVFLQFFYLRFAAVWIGLDKACLWATRIKFCNGRAWC